MLRTEHAWSSIFGILQALRFRKQRTKLTKRPAIGAQAVFVQTWEDLLECEPFLREELKNIVKRNEEAKDNGT